MILFWRETNSINENGIVVTGYVFGPCTMIKKYYIGAYAHVKNHFIFDGRHFTTEAKMIRAVNEMSRKQAEGK